MDHARENFVRNLIAIVDDTVELLGTYKDKINALNVYPVPDGDTGTNLYLTMMSVQAEVGDTKNVTKDLSACVGAISKGALMGARGNSGVIFSQIIRGFSEGVEQASSNGETFQAGICRGLQRGSELADAAVMRPVEGTILTVARNAANAASKNALMDAQVFATALYRASSDALLDTPNLLTVLKEADVVDAGGSGFVLFVEAIANALGSSSVDRERPWLNRSTPGLCDVRTSGVSDTRYRDISQLKYEVMFLLEASAVSISAFKEVWAGIGDSIVVVGQDPLWNCHIHTDDIGASIEAAIQVGRPKNIRVTDLSEQVIEERWVIAGSESGSPDPSGVSSAGAVTAVVAVANGEGIGRIFRSMGVNRIIMGGQSMNPSTADLVDAMDDLDSDQIVILPNNSNIIPVANMACEVSSRRVMVIPTRGVIEGFAALMEYDPAAGIEENMEAMSTSFQRVRTGEVTQAVRDSSWKRGGISVGDFLGISNDGIISVDRSLAGASRALLDDLLQAGGEIVTLIEGEGSTPAITREIEQWLLAVWPGVEIETHHGGQPLYSYLIGVE